jgi:hypothetical protein
VNGEPERLGDERNLRRSLPQQRVADMKAAIARQGRPTSQALKRELAKLN